MEEAQLTLRFDSAQALQAEYEANLKHGRAFVAGARGFEPLSPCELTLVHPDSEQEFTVAGEIVMVRDDNVLCGVGIQLHGLDADELSRFVLPAARPSQMPGRIANRHDQLREMSLAEQLKIARQGDLNDRVLLERHVGKPVWEALLGNPRITVVEVARIAKKGTAPRPMIEQIVDQAAWIQNGLVRRALLSNPKLTPDGIAKVLRVMPRPELKLLEKQTGYPSAVRDAARKMTGG